MATGIPGAGIGGLFYLANALLLPFHGLRRRARGETVAWRPILIQFSIAAGILLGIWVAGWLLGLWIGASAGTVSQRTFGAGSATRTARLLGLATIYLSIGTLALVLLSVQVARVLIRRPR
ncbi:MAG TPA: hypothetical protein VFU23_15035 [Gemmatimonadales bacterium]|nr:hypothetical protein [Gemmatimonadales bacterium]